MAVGLKPAIINGWWCDGDFPKLHTSSLAYCKHHKNDVWHLLVGSGWSDGGFP